MWWFIVFLVEVFPWQTISWQNLISQNLFPWHFFFYLIWYGQTNYFLSFRFRRLRLDILNTKAYSSEFFKLVYQSSIVFLVNWYFHVADTLANNKAIDCSLMILTSRHLGFEHLLIQTGYGRYRIKCHKATFISRKLNVSVEIWCDMEKFFHTWINSRENK